MPPSRRLQIIRVCLLTFVLTLLGATAIALAANTHRPPTASLHAHVSKSPPNARSGREASRTKRQCKSGVRKGRLRRIASGKCAAGKPKSRSLQTGATTKRPSSRQPSSPVNAESGTHPPGIGGPVTEPLVTKTPTEEIGPSPAPGSPDPANPPPGKSTAPNGPAPPEELPEESPEGSPEELPVTYETPPTSQPTSPVETSQTSEPIPTEPTPIQTEPTPVPTEPSEPTPVETAEPIAPNSPFRFFASSSFWNEPVTDAPVDPSSAATMETFANFVAEEEQKKVGGPWLNTTEYSVPVYTVPKDQPTVTVQLTSHRAYKALAAAWSTVPLPSDAQPAAGTDGELVVWQPSTDKLWEFWRLVHETDGNWSASWGGAMQNVSSNPGVYGPEAWPEASSLWGASASSLSLVGGLISLEDLERGEIDHAISMSLPDIRAGVYASPAQRTDGDVYDSLALPEGAHLRLDPHLNLAALHLPKLTLMIAKAAQRYGIFVRDHSKVLSLQAQDPVTSPTNPYLGSDGYFEGLKTPRKLLEAFPWSHLELLKMELHKTE